jgi:hypothetical protein
MRRYVVDTGMVKQKLYNAQTGLECLKVRTGPSYLSCAAVARRTRIPTEKSFGCASMQAEDVRARLPGSGSCLRLPLHPCLKQQHAAAVSAPLGRVPVLGFLFQRKERDKGRRELVVIIRPYVMTTPEDGQRISRDVLQRLAPESAQRLVEEGFLPSLLPPPPASPVASPNPALSPAPAPAELPQPTVSKKRFWNR